MWEWSHGRVLGFSCTLCTLCTLLVLSIPDIPGRPSSLAGDDAGGVRARVGLGMSYDSLTKLSRLLPAQVGSGDDGSLGAMIG